jgi:hypothetical protein
MAPESNSNTVCETWGSQGGQNVDIGLRGYDAVWTLQADIDVSEKHTSATKMETVD